MPRVSKVTRPSNTISTGLLASKSRIEAAILAALREEGESVLSRSQQLVPTETGSLLSSGKVSEPTKTSSGGYTLSIGYGSSGPSAPYAVAIHEHPSAASPPSWAGGTVRFSPSGTGPKFLEKAILEASKGFSDRILAKVFSAIGKKV